MAQILIVEDNAVNAKLLKVLLDSRGHEPLLATTAAEADSVLARGGVELVLLDIQLPGVDGLQFVRKLRRQGAMSDLPVVAVSGYAAPGDRREALEAGCDAFFAKPLDIEALMADVESRLGA